MKPCVLLAAVLSLSAAFLPMAHAAPLKARMPLLREDSRPPAFTLPADGTMGANGGEQPRQISLHSFLGRKRIVLVFAPTRQALDQIHRGEYEERDLVVLAILRPSDPLNTVAAPPLYILTDTTGAVSRAYHAPPGQTAFYLIGKDGTIKMVRHDYPTNQELFGTIDAMPMRRLEMRERKR